MRILALFLAAFAAILIFTGCESNGGYRVTVEKPASPPPVVVHEDRHGPPPHAPAHGYRAKHPDGCELVYDRSCGCYTVVGYNDYYYNDGFFFRFGSDGWQISAHVGGNDARWEHCDDNRVPGGMKSKHKDKGHGKGKGKDKGHGNHQGDDDRQSMLDTSDIIAPIVEARWGKY